MGNADLEKAGRNGNAKLLLKYSGQVKFIDIKPVGKCIQRNSFHIMLLQIFFEFQEILSLTNTLRRKYDN